MGVNKDAQSPRLPSAGSILQTAGESRWDGRVKGAKHPDDVIAPLTSPCLEFALRLDLKWSEMTHFFIDEQASVGLSVVTAFATVSPNSKASPFPRT